MNDVHDLPHRTDALDQVLALAVLLNEDMANALADLGLTVARARVVWLLHHGGPVTQRDLAETLHVTPRAVTTLVDALASTDYVARRPHPTDRRATLVTLTERGIAVMAAMDSAHRELADQLFGDLSPARFRCFVEGLAHVLDRLRDAIAAQRKEGS